MPISARGCDAPPVNQIRRHAGPVPASSPTVEIIARQQRGLRGSWMPGQARHDEDAGFTLVELMVVITIIALLSAVTLWALPPPGGRVADEALRFAARVRVARDSAVVGAAPVSLWVTPGGYGFDRRVAGRWAPVADRPLRVERWAEGTRADLSGAGDVAAGRARIVFDPTGLPDRAADVRLTKGGRAMLVRLDADGSVRADVQ